uniref:Clathrin light chain n=1 Tax=Acrobeloides nanus TaxID=290746 RepID=A0A914CXZ8_9BILA
AKYDKFVEENKKRDKAAEEAHARSVTKLSAEAKEADKKLWKIAHSPTLTGKQKEDQIRDVIKSLPSKVKEEIDKEQSAGSSNARRVPGVGNVDGDMAVDGVDGADGDINHGDGPATDGENKSTKNSRFIKSYR